jgi:hypothetical protein
MQKLTFLEMHLSYLETKTIIAKFDELQFQAIFNGSLYFVMFYLTRNFFNKFVKIIHFKFCLL